MKKLSSIIILLFLSLSALAQSANLLEYTVQVKEIDSGYAIIVGGNDLISSEYYKTRVDIGIKETVDEAVNRLNKLHFNVKATTTVNGKQVVTMSVKVDPYQIESIFKETLRYGEMLDTMFNQMFEIEYGN